MFHLAATGGPLGAAAAWAAAGTYALQIYFDFSGYSDMAIGLARMFGLVLPINFDAPYRAVSVRDFWRRWHITLSRFLRDYLYIPLGGNRRGAARQAVNVVVTMLLGGLWHGAGWTFVAWGGLHGAALAVNGAWNRAGWRMPRAVGWAITLLFVLAAWVLFRAPDFATAGRMLWAMLGIDGIGRVKVDDAAVVLIAAGLALLGPTSQELALRRLPPARWVALPAGAALVAMLLLVGGRIPMRSSISSSDPRTDAAGWRRFLRAAIGSALAIGLALYAFIVVIDPWNTLPLSPPLPRVPVTSNARFVFPALARSGEFDSAIFGTSTSRLLRPAVLDPRPRRAVRQSRDEQRHVMGAIPSAPGLRARASASARGDDRPRCDVVPDPRAVSAKDVPPLSRLDVPARPLARLPAHLQRLRLAGGGQRGGDDGRPQAAHLRPRRLYRFHSARA